MAYYDTLFGVGKGEAQVFDTSGLAYQYQQQLANLRKRHDAENEALSKFTADFKYDKVRDADVDNIRNDYNQVLKLNSDYLQAKDRDSRLKLKSQINSKMNELAGIVQSSRNAKDAEKSLHQLTLNRNNKLLPGFADKFSKLRQTSIYDPSYRSLAEDHIFQSPFEPEYDLGKTTKSILEAGTVKVNKSPYATSIKGAPGMYIASQTGQRFDPNLAKSKFESAIKDEGFVYGLNKRYNPDGQLTPEQVVGQAWNDILTEGQRINNVNTSVSGRVDREPRQGSQFDGLYRNVGVTSVPYTSQSGGKQPVFNMEDTVPVSLPADDLIGMQAYNATTGELETIPNVIGNARVVAIGRVPYIKSGKATKMERKGGKVTQNDRSLTGEIAQPGFIKKNGDGSVDWKTQVMVTTGGDYPQTYFVDEDKVPNSKKFQQALNAHRSGSKKQVNSQEAKPSQKSTFNLEDYMKKKGLK